MTLKPILSLNKDRIRSKFSINHDNQMLDLNISIVNWNTKELLRKCLESIFNNNSGLSCKIWVADNASSDGSAEMIEKEFPQVEVIKNSTNLGFVKANNQILSQCEGKYALLLNSDTEVIGNSLKEMVDFMDAHPEAGGAGCRLLNDDGTLQTSCGRFPRLSSIFFGGEICNRFFKKIVGNKKFFAEYGLSEEEHLYFQEVDFVKGCCLIVRNSVLEKIGLLDENIFMYFEEIDLCYRIKQQGMKILYSPQPRVKHLGGQSSRIIDQKVYRNLSSQEYFFRKHRGNHFAFAMKWVVVFGSLVRLPIFLISYFFVNKALRPTVKYKLLWTLYSLKWSIRNVFEWSPSKRQEEY